MRSSDSSSEELVSPLSVGHLHHARGVVGAVGAAVGGAVVGGAVVGVDVLGGEMLEVAGEHCSASGNEAQYHVPLRPHWPVVLLHWMVSFHPATWRAWTGSVLFPPGPHDLSRLVVMQTIATV